MAMTRTHIAAPMGAALIYRAVTLVEEAVAELRAMPRTRTLRKSLESLSDWELNDLGVVRADIHAIARRAGRCHR